MSDSGQPARPYATPAATGGNAGRGGEFSAGIDGDPGSQSLTLASQRYNAMVPPTYRPSSVLQPIMQRSANGMSADDASRRWADGSYMGSVNGTAQSSFEPAAMLRLSGLNADE